MIVTLSAFGIRDQTHFERTDQKMMIGILAIAISTAVVYLFDAAITWGAHPFWATQVILVGAAIGTVFYLLPLLRPTVKLSLLIVLALTAFAIATYGKTQFAASYAEDTFAGQLWYFGWHATLAAGFAAIGSAAKLALLRLQTKP